VKENAGDGGAGERPGSAVGRLMAGETLGAIQIDWNAICTQQHPF